jgi:uncharacterized protein (TIGR02466 family)
MVNGKKGYKRVEADVLKQAQFVFEDLYSERKGGYDMVNMWVNNNSKGDYHKLHVHPDCDLSGCFYVNTPVKSGNIRFEDPNYLLKMNQETLNKHVMTFVTRVTVDYVPTVGKLLFFPSWLRHEVLQNHSEEERISIAFNLKLRFD